MSSPKIDANWQKTDVPHNWDQYYGYRRMKHGNLHGTAWYHKTFSVDKKDKDKRLFLYFEGVSSYATVWVNGIKVGAHKVVARLLQSISQTPFLLKGKTI